MNFDEKAKTWDLNPITIERTQAIANAIHKSVPVEPDFSVFEYGCGTGLLSFHFQPQVKSICLADTSEGMLAVLRAKISTSGVKNMTPMKIDGLSEQIPIEQFDLIYTAMTLHHIKDISQILNLFQTMLKKSGYLCIADLDKEDGSFHEDPFDGHLGFDREYLQKELIQQKLEIISSSTAYEMTKILNGQPKVFPIFLMTARKPSY